MLEFSGKYNKAKVFTDNIEQEAISQIINLLNQEFVKNSKIRIMPDVHAGAGCVIGTTMTITDSVVPNLVGVDIGCGMETSIFSDTDIDFQRLDEIIHKYVPAGFSARTKQHPFMSKIDLSVLRCIRHVNRDRAELSMGTLGGGNHFIELGKGNDRKLYLVVHSGSRNLGLQIAKYYQDAALKSFSIDRSVQQRIIDELKSHGRQSEIQEELRKLQPPKFDRTLAYATGSLFDDYMHDMAIAQRYAELNRKAIIETILKHMNLEAVDSFTTTHNYIDMGSRILRKGAISAKLGERVLIPMNMRDGSIVAAGKGNNDWNQSAPHGAGRLMSRTMAKQVVKIEDFQETMQGIYSSTVNNSTLDEAPMAYKPMDEIIANTKDTIDIITIVKPLYNFKSAE